MWLSIGKIIFKIRSADPEITTCEFVTLPLYNIGIICIGTNILITIDIEAYRISIVLLVFARDSVHLYVGYRDKTYVLSQESKSPIYGISILMAFIQCSCH